MTLQRSQVEGVLKAILNHIEKMCVLPVQKKRWMREAERLLLKPNLDYTEVYRRIADIASKVGFPRDHALIAEIRNFSQCSRQNQEISVDEKKHEIAVVTAMRQPELELFLDLLTDVQELTEPRIDLSTSFLFHEGKIPTQDGDLHVVVGVQSQMGMVDSAILATHLIQGFRPRYIIMNGVAGGRQGHANIGDVVVATEVFNYQAGKHVDTGFLPDPSMERTNESIIQWIDSNRYSFGDDVYRTWPGDDFGTPRIRLGPMACGSAVVDKVGMLKEIVGMKRSVVAVDMESFAVFRAAALSRSDSYRCEPIVAKGIMDFTEQKHDKAKQFAAYTSAMFVRWLAINRLKCK